MPYKLKNLKITSTHLVDQGANPEAFVCLFKRKDDSFSSNKLNPITSINKSGLSPDQLLSFQNMEAIHKAQKEEISELKKSLEIHKLTAFALKYEILGKNPDELALKLFHMKEGGGTVFHDYVSLLDECLTLIEENSFFTEKGSDNSGSPDTLDRLGAAARKIAKSSDLNTPDAIVKAWDNNPQLAADYENQYRSSFI